MKEKGQWEMLNVNRLGRENKKVVNKFRSETSIGLQCLSLYINESSLAIAVLRYALYFCFEFT